MKVDLTEEEIDWIIYACGCENDMMLMDCFTGPPEGLEEKMESAKKKKPNS